MRITIRRLSHKNALIIIKINGGIVMKKLLSLISCILFLFSTSSSVFSATELVPSSVGELVYAGNWNGHGYAVIHNAPASWLEAKAYCESMGGYLAAVTSAAENECDRQ